MAFHNAIVVLWFVKNIFLSVGALAIIFYTVWYFFMLNWRKYPAGRQVLGFIASLVAVMGYTLVSLFDSDSYLNFPLVDPALYRVLFGDLVFGIVAYTAIRLDITIVRSWRDGESTDHHGTNPFLPDERTDRRRVSRGK